MPNKADEGANRLEAWRKMFERHQKKGTLEKAVDDTVTPFQQLFTILNLDVTNPTHRALVFCVICDFAMGLESKPGRPKGSQKWDTKLLVILGAVSEMIEGIRPRLTDAKIATIIKGAGFNKIRDDRIDAWITKGLHYFTAVDVGTIRKRLPQARRVWNEAKAKPTEPL
jgi:hypothetical protein